MKQKTKVIFASLLILLIGVVSADILIQKQVETTLRIKRSFAMDIFDVDGTTELTSINLGDFLWGEMFYYPGKTPDAPTTQHYFVNNTDQTDFYVQFICSIPPELTGQLYVWIYLRRIDQTTFTETRSGAIYQYPLTSPTLDPDHPLWHEAEWHLFVWALEPVFGNYTITLTFSAVDSPTG